MWLTVAPPSPIPTLALVIMVVTTASPARAFALIARRGAVRASAPPPAPPRASLPRASALASRRAVALLPGGGGVRPPPSPPHASSSHPPPSAWLRRRLARGLRLRASARAPTPDDGDAPAEAAAPAAPPGGGTPAAHEPHPSSSDASARVAVPGSSSRRRHTHQLITFFKFATVPDHDAEVAAHRAFIEENGLEIRGRIYINQQGINAQMSGRGEDGETYARWVEAREPFRGMRVSVYPTREHAHPKLSLRHKPMIVQLEGGTAHLPLHDPSRRGTPLSPKQWHEMLNEKLDRDARADDSANSDSDSDSDLSGDDDARDLREKKKSTTTPVLLDVRNGYEWDVGHFRGAARPVQESFRETVETNVEEGAGPLAGVDKATPIMMYCTGGIRCDVYSTVLKEQGYAEVYTLEGGVQAYFDEYGKGDGEKGRAASESATESDASSDASDSDAADEEKSPAQHLWDDHLFVFDSRLAMTPEGVPAAEAGARAATLTCHCCAAPRAPPPHRNCPNVDCNRLFLVCDACVRRLGGFCCAECGKAAHVRPRLLTPGRYQKYAHYVEGAEASRSERRGDGRRLKRRRRTERKRKERAERAAREASPRDLVRAVRVLEKAVADPRAFDPRGPDEGSDADAGGERASSGGGSGSGTLAARTRAIVKAAGLLDVVEAGDDDDAAEFAERRRRLREAAEAIAAGRDPGVDLGAFSREETKAEQ